MQNDKKKKCCSCSQGLSSLQLSLCSSQWRLCHASVGACQDIRPVLLWGTELAFTGPCYAPNTQCVCMCTTANSMRPVTECTCTTNFYTHSALAGAAILYSGGGNPICAQDFWHHAKGLQHGNDPAHPDVELYFAVWSEICSVWPINKWSNSPIKSTKDVWKAKVWYWKARKGEEVVSPVNRCSWNGKY